MNTQGEIYYAWGKFDFEFTYQDDPIYTGDASGHAVVAEQAAKDYALKYHTLTHPIDASRNMQIRVLKGGDTEPRFFSVRPDVLYTVYEMQAPKEMV